MYASANSEPMTIRLSKDLVIYFKRMAEDAGVPYQSLIKVYLRDGLGNNRKVQINWLKLS
jgi:predicted DNA binding CopG/RHH family protein